VGDFNRVKVEIPLLLILLHSLIEKPISMPELWLPRKWWLQDKVLVVLEWSEFVWVWG